jgi:DNA-directed RNA polymerases I, II, and III subunit RPABC1
MNSYRDRLWRTYQTLQELLKDRHYDGVVAGLVVDNFSDFCEQFTTEVGDINKEAMSFVAHNSKTGKLILIVFAVEDSIGRKHCETIYLKMQTGRISNCILIYPNILTTPAVNYLSKTPRAVIEAFAEDDLVVNITKHKLMPRHRLLTSHEKKDFLTNGKFKETQLPLISVSDPMARYHGARRGDIFEITRKSETGGLYVTFRICA